MIFRFIKKAANCVTLLFLLFQGCTTISNQYKMDEYGRVMYDYDTVMQLSDFNAACKYVNPVIIQWEECLKRYENVKIFDYKLLAIKVAEDKMEVTQKVEATYHFLDQVVVEKISYEQSWRYQEESKTWVLQTAPPIFDQ